MNGDLSLSQALGGLRIANPDDSAPSPPPQEEDMPTTVARSTSRSAPVDPSGRPANASGDYHSSSGPTNSQFSARPGGHGETVATLQSAAANTSFNPSLRHPEQTGQPAFNHYPQNNQNHHNGNSTITTGIAPRPSSGIYSNPRSVEPDSASAAYHNNYRTAPDAPRPSGWDMATHGEPRSAAAFAAPTPSREPSQRERSQNGLNPRQHMPLPAGSGPLPPRRSSKGMAGGYALIPGVPVVAPSSNPDLPLPTSSEEWQERGAAVGVRREVDANGRSVVRSVKKGVRDFNFGRTLGEGSYSTVYLATDKQNLREYAIKVLEKRHIIKEKKIKYVNIEKNTLNRLTEHPGIVRLYYTFQDETQLFYVLDLCSGGELLGVLKKTGTFDVECTRFYGAQILDAIDYMHSRGVIHRDLKPENVLLDERMHIKITDFGTAKLLPDPRAATTQDMLDRGPEPEQEERAASFVGTAEYVSPELLTDKSASKASDIWAFGCIIYQLLAGRPPFKGGSEYLTFQKIVGLDYEFPPGFPPAARDLVERCLVLDPARRLTVEHIRNHEFFDGQVIGKELWRTKAPRLRPFVPPAPEHHVINLNGGSTSSAPQNLTPSRSNGQPQSNGAQQRPRRIITELPPPTQLDLDWSPVLTRTNERILKLGDLMVISSPLPHSPHSKGEGEGHKKLARFFGGSTTKKRRRLVMVTSSGRIVLAPEGGEEKKTKQEISLLAPDCTWRTQIDAKGQPIWCVDTGGVHYAFEEPKSVNSTDIGKITVDDWIESLERAKEFAQSQNTGGSYDRDTGFGDMSSSMSSPASTLGGRATYPEYGEGFTVSDRSGRAQILSRSQASLEEQVTERKRNRFSKRQSKNGLGAAF